MMNDLISRSALLDEIKKSAFNNPYTDSRMRMAHLEEHNHFRHIVNDAPAVGTAPQWISVEDRLPEDDSLVLIAIKFADGEFVWHKGSRITLKNWLDSYNGNSKFYWLQIPPVPKEET